MMDADDERLLERYFRDKSKAEAKDKLVEVAQVCNCIGQLLSKYGRYEEAIKEHTQERQLCEALQDSIGEAVACRRIGECHCALGQYSQALELQKRHLTVARECQNSLEEQRAWATIGRTYLCKAESRNLMESSLANKHAEKAFIKALEACEKVKSTVQPAEYLAMKCRVLLNIGLVYDNREDVKKSTDVIGRAVLIARKHHLDAELLMCHSSLTLIYQNDRKYNQALRSCQQGVRLAQKLRDKLQECDLLTTMATVRVAMGDFLEGKHCLKKAHRLKVKSDDKKITTMFKTVNKMQETHHELEADEDESDKFKLYEIFADCLAELSLYKDAIDYYLKVLTGTRLSDEKKAAIYVSLAQTYLDTRQYESAIFYYKKELEICQGNNPEQACRTHLNIAELEELNGSRYSTVCKIYMDAFDLAKKAKHVRLMLRSLKSLTVVQRLCEQWKHLEETEKTLGIVRRKYGLKEGINDGDSQEDDEEEQDSEDRDGDLPRESETSESDLSLSDLTVSEDSCEEGSDDEKRVVQYKRKKSDIARRNEKGETPLHRACIEGSLKKVKSLIEKGHPINLRDHCGWIPLHEAANHGHDKIVEFLLERGACINDRGGEMCGGVTPLIDAANCGNLEVMSVLMRHGASLLAKDDKGNTALDCLQFWYNTNGDSLSASESLKYHQVEKLLRGVIGKNHNGPRSCKSTKSNTHQKEQSGSSAPVTSSTYDSSISSSSLPSKNPRASSSVVQSSRQARRPKVRDRSKRLPDLEDVLEEEENNSTSSVRPTLKGRFSELRTKRLQRLFNKSTNFSQPTVDGHCHSNQIHDFADNTSKNNSIDLGDSIEQDLPENPRRPDSNMWNNATDAYRQVMESMRSSALSRVGAEEEDKENSDRSDDEQLGDENTNKKLPYMENNVDVGDDWLIDDVGDLPKTKGKKRSYEINSILSSYQLKSKSSKKGSKLKRARYEKGGDNLDALSTALPSETAKTSTSLSTNSGNILDEMFGLDSDSEDYNTSIQNHPTSVASLPSELRNHSNNTEEVGADKPSTTDFWESDGDDDLLASTMMYESFVTDNSDTMFRNGRDESSNVGTSQMNNSVNLHQDSQVSSSSSSSVDKSRNQSVNVPLKMSSLSSNPKSRQGHSSSYTQSNHLPKPTNQPMEKSSNSKSCVSDSHVPEVKKLKFSVKVNIEGNTLIVPIFENDECKTMAWLAQQTAERYFSSFYVYPVLTLKTTDGIFCPTDPIGSILNSVTELHADVLAWNKQSAAERYEKVCEAFYENCRSNIKLSLQNIGKGNNKVDLNDMNLGLQSLLPVFQALDGERSLVELRLTGNRLSDSGILSLTKLLSSLPDLKVLVLDSNELTLEGLEALASFVQNNSKLQSLTELSLSYNCLTDKADAPITILLKNIHNLTSLKLTACYLTNDFFSPKLVQVLSESSVSVLTLSENQFSKDTIHKVIKSVSSSLKDLDLAYSFSSQDLNVGLDTVLQPVARVDGSVLQSLSLAGCHLSMSDVLVVNRLPALISSLSQLNISQNRNFDNTSLQKLVSISTCAQSNLHTISARGCTICSPLGDELLDALKLKLQSRVPLVKLTFSCRGLTSAESDLLSNVWIGKWKEVGKVKTSGVTVNLSVISSSPTDDL